MQTKELVKRVSQLALPKTDELGISIWDVDFIKEGAIYCLNIYLDGDREISITDCELVSRFIDPLLDASDFDSLPSYSLCVSSAGLERRLVRPEHFEKFIGSDVQIGCYTKVNGAKTHDGSLVSFHDGDITINTDGVEQIFKKDDVSSCRLTIKF